MCTTEDANTGFNHVCRVYKDDEEVLKTRVNWGNRTWESYQYASVFEQAKSLLYDKLNGEKTELDTDFLDKLVFDDYIYGYGEDEDGYNHILVDSWKQVDEGSVWDKLLNLAKKNLLKPSVAATMLALEDSQLFTDEYGFCDECGKIYNHQWGDLKITDYGYVSDNCIKENPEYLEELVNKAKEDFESAVPATISLKALEELGYEPIGDIDEPFSCSESQWGERRWGYSYADIDFLKKLCEMYGGFAKIDSVQQFDSTFYIMLPVDCIKEGNRALETGCV